MDIVITPRPLSGKIQSIPSKSRAHRLLILAALSKIPSRLILSESSRDIDATIESLNALGANITKTDEGLSVTPIKEVPPHPVLDVGESGSTLRFLLPVIGALGADATFLLSGRLPSRPLSPLWEELVKGGMSLSREKESAILCGGKLYSGAYTLPGDISSQFISGLLFALPLLEGDSTLRITGKTESLPYILMTEDAMALYGITCSFENGVYKIRGGQRPKPPENATIVVEGDWSNAAFWLTAGALGKGITCTNLSPCSLQGDKAILSLLKAFGAKIEATEDGFSAKAASLSCQKIDASQIPDLVPILSVAAAACHGETMITGASRLRLKESDRIKTVCRMLSALGGTATETSDGLIIKGNGVLSGGTVDSAGDHRIAMSAAIASMISIGTVTVKGGEAVAKSYPKFWEHFSALGGLIERRD